MESQSTRKGKDKGILFIVSAPSGAGKTTLVRRVTEELPNLKYSVSYTTRSPRANEREGEDYHFISTSLFQKMVEEDQFLEWAEVSGNCYGTTWSMVERLKSEGRDVILDIDPQGAKKVLERIPHSVSIFILPPSPEALRERLMRRGLDPPEAIRLRLANARKEMEESVWYHYVIINDHIEEAMKKLKAIIIAERCRVARNGILEEKKRSWEEEDGKDYSRGLSEKGGESI